MPGLPTLARVIDRDTPEMRAQVWLGQELATRVRLADIDSPKLNGEASSP